ncbi:MAG: helix-turn-helix domain-containing protein [Gemmatimonadales bacterium]
MPTVFWLDDFLGKNGMTQAELARSSGVAIRTISRLLHNETGQVSLDTLDRLAGALGIEPGALIVRETGKRKR